MCACVCLVFFKLVLLFRASLICARQLKKKNPSRICSLPSGAVSYCCHCQSRSVWRSPQILRCIPHGYRPKDPPGPWSGGVLCSLAPDVSGSCFWFLKLQNGAPMVRIVCPAHPTDAPLDWDLEYQTCWLCSSRVPEPLLLVSGGFIQQKEEIKENMMVPWTSSDSSSAQPEYPRPPQISQVMKISLWFTGHTKSEEKEPTYPHWLALKDGHTNCKQAPVIIHLLSIQTMICRNKWDVNIGLLT